MPETHHREFSELPLNVERGAERSLPVQLAGSLREAIDAGTLRPGEAVPATRELARRLGVARGVVVAAYQQLIAEGYLSARHGRGTRVHPELRGLSRAAEPAGSVAGEKFSIPDEGLNLHAGPLAPGTPDTSAVSTTAWRAAWREAASRAHLEPPALGVAALRAQIAEHLRRMRGTARPASDVIVTAGAREGLGLLLTTLGSARGRSLVVGVEEPGYPSLRKVLAAHGAKIVALPVDGEGLMTRVLPEQSIDVVIVTPSHQYPLGGSLPLLRRRELLEWAASSGAVIVEDDYDSELRHTGSPLPTLAALDDRESGVVVLLGTFSKTVSPALSAGYLLAPARLRRRIEPVRHDLGGPVSAVVQIALAEYLASGELRRHTARVRRRYASRRELVVERLLGVAGVRVRAMSGGLHAVIELTRGSAETEQRVANRGRSLGVVPLGAYWHGQSGGFGLVIGTGGSLGEAEFVAALDALRAILREEISAQQAR